MWPALIGAGSQIINGLMGFFGQKKANETNINLAREARDYQTEMWNKQNAYNTPAEQMARFRDAGLNPNLIYSQGTPGIASSPPSAPVAKVANVMDSLSSMNFLPVLSMYKDWQLKDAAISKAVSEKELIDNRIINEGLRAPLLRLAGDTGNFKLMMSKYLASTQIEAAKANLYKSQLYNANLAWQIENMNPVKKHLLETQKGYLTKMSGLKDIELNINRGLAPYNMDSKTGMLWKALLPSLKSLFSGSTPVDSENYWKN